MSATGSVLFLFSIVLFVAQKRSRRDYIKGVGIAGIASLAGCSGGKSGSDGGGSDGGTATTESDSASGSASTSITWGTIATESTTCMDCVQPTPSWELQRRLKKKPDTGLKMNLVPEGKICGASTCGSKVQTGVVDVGYGSIGNSTNFWPENNVWLVPYTFPSKAAELHTLFKEETWKNYWIPFAKKYGVVPTLMWSSDLRQIFLSEEGAKKVGGKVETPEDIQGLKIRRTASRSPKIALNQWGANPAKISWGETIQAMKTGLVQGLETWGAAAAAFGMASVIDQAVLINFMSGQGMNWVSTEALKNLSPEQREEFAETTKDLTEDMAALVPEVRKRVGLESPPPEGSTFAENDITVSEIGADTLEKWRQPVDPTEHPDLYTKTFNQVDNLDMPVDDIYSYIHETARESSVPDSLEDFTIDSWWDDHLDEI